MTSLNLEPESRSIILSTLVLLTSFNLELKSTSLNQEIDLHLPLKMTRPTVDSISNIKNVDNENQAEGAVQNYKDQRSMSSVLLCESTSLSQGCRFGPSVQRDVLVRRIRRSLLRTVSRQILSLKGEFWSHSDSTQSKCAASLR